MESGFRLSNLFKLELSFKDKVHKEFYKQTKSIEELLIWATENECSDLWVKLYERPFISRYGNILELPCTPITRDSWSNFYDLYVLNELNAVYVRRKLLDTSVEVRIPVDSKNFGKYESNFYRYRANFGFSQEQNICTFRMIRPSKPTFETINYPEDCKESLNKVLSSTSNIVIINGKTGTGKSTTLAACINSFTRKNEVLDNKVIITLEDPIENTFSNTPSTKIIQKELDKDFNGFALGIKASLREHPTTILVGECRDKEVICATLEAARTGHLVATTFHASDVAGTLSRLLYHLDNDKNLSYDLIINLGAIYSQQLIPSDNGYLVDVQYLMFNDYVKKFLIRTIDEDKNIAVEVASLFDNKELIENGIIRDWEYKNSIF